MSKKIISEIVTKSKTIIFLSTLQGNSKFWNVEEQTNK